MKSRRGRESHLIAEFDGVTAVRSILWKVRDFSEIGKAILRHYKNIHSK